MTLTHEERIILRAIQELGENAYGVPVMERVNEMRHGTGWFNSPMSAGAFYVTAGHLHHRGLISDYTMPGTPERGGRERTHWYLTRQGIEALEATA